MTTKILFTSLILLIMISCDFSASVQTDLVITDLVTGGTTTGNGLTCASVTLSNEEGDINKPTFVYGEKFFLNFNDVKGFTKEGENVFPGMSILVLGASEDTVMYSDDLYGNDEGGLNLTGVLLKGWINIASPISSKQNYKLLVNIWDKKGDGTYSLEMDFDVVPNELIKIESNSISYDEIYLYSAERKVCISNNKANFNEHIYVLFEGLSGFKTKDGKSEIGLSMTAKDYEGNIILNEEDLMNDKEIEASELKKQLTSHFIFSNSEIKNPVACEVKIWDKNSDVSIAASMELNIQ